VTEQPLQSQDGQGPGAGALRAHYTPPQAAGGVGRLEMSFVGTVEQQLTRFGARDFVFVQHMAEQLAAILTAHIQPSAKGEVPLHNLNAALQAIDAIGPANEAEALFAVQAIALHYVTMDCLARAANPKATIEGRALNLNHANKSARTFTMLMEGLNRHRGKVTTQKVIVENVTVAACVRRSLASLGGRGIRKLARFNAMRREMLAADSAPRCLAQTRSGRPCQQAAIKGRRRCRMHGGARGIGAPKGNQNRLIHGFYSRAERLRRLRIRLLLKSSHDLLI